VKISPSHSHLLWLCYVLPNFLIDLVFWFYQYALWISVVSFFG
jgi:hypothetical protein